MDDGVTGTHAATVRALNDALRTTFEGGHVLLTPCITGLTDETRTALLSAVRSFTEFTGDNDPHGEHDFGSIRIDDQIYFWKIDYYAPDMQGGVEDATLPETVRVLTIMRADEY